MAFVKITETTFPNGAKVTRKETIDEATGRPTQIEITETPASPTPLYNNPEPADPPPSKNPRRRRDDKHRPRRHKSSANKDDDRRRGGERVGSSSRRREDRGGERRNHSSSYHADRRRTQEPNNSNPERDVRRKQSSRRSRHHRHKSRRDGDDDARERNPVPSPPRNHQDHAVDERSNGIPTELHIPIEVDEGLPQEVVKVAGEELHQACEYPQNLEKIKEMVEGCPPSIECRAHNGNLPLHTACLNKAQKDVLLYLIKKYPMGIRKIDNGGNLPIHLACFSSCPFQSVQFLFRLFPESASKENNDHERPLDKAKSPFYEPPNGEVIGFLETALLGQQTQIRSPPRPEQHVSATHRHQSLSAAPQIESWDRPSPPPDSINYGGGVGQMPQYPTAPERVENTLSGLRLPPGLSESDPIVQEALLAQMSSRRGF